LTKNARCGMCVNIKSFESKPNKNYGVMVGFECSEGFEIQYPTITHIHHCKEYKFKKVKVKKIPRGKINIFIGLIDELKECKSCSYNFKRYCDGIRWHPFEITPKCEFYINKNLICKHAIPHFQYNNSIRNNFCSLHPVNRDREMNRGWEWQCPLAHSQYSYPYKCYEPKKKVKGGEK